MEESPLSKFLVVSEVMHSEIASLLDAECRSLGMYDLTHSWDMDSTSRYKAVVLMGDSVTSKYYPGHTLKTLSESKLEYMGVPVLVTKSIAAVAFDKEVLTYIAKTLYAARILAGGEVTWDRDWNSAQLCNSMEQLIGFRELVRHTGRVSFDTETTGLDIVKDRVTTLSMSAQPGHSIILLGEHAESSSVAVNLSQPEVVSIVQEIMAMEGVVKVAQNIKFDMHMLRRNYGIVLKGVIYDLMMMHHALFNYMKHGLKDMVDEYFPAVSGYEMELAKYNNDWANMLLKDLVPYAGIDSDATLRLSYVFEDMLAQLPEVYNMFRNIFCSAVKPLFEMEYRGCPVNRSMLEDAITKATAKKEEYYALLMENPMVQKYISSQHKENINKEVERCKDKIATSKTAKAVKNWEGKLAEAMAGNVEIPTFNPDSPVQLKKLLYARGYGFEFPLPLDEYEKPVESTNKDYIQEIDDPSGFIDNLLIYRGISKTLSTYLISIVEKLDDSGRLHGKFNQAGAGTYRMSSSDPNLQNIISRSKYAPVMEVVDYVKKSFTPLPNEVLIQADLSQAELRFMAHYSQDRVMIDAYNSGKDLHVIGACDTMHITEEAFHQLDKAEQKTHRQRAKARNFGLIYGMGAKKYRSYAKTSYGVILTEEEATNERLGFFRMFQSLLPFHERMREMVHKYGYVTVLFGGRVHIPDIHSFIPRQISGAERNALNSPIQGTAGLWTEFAIALLHHRLDPRVSLLNTVHDSIIASCPPELVEDTVRIMRDTLSSMPTKQYFNFELSLPMGVDFEYSLTSWKELCSYEELKEQLSSAKAIV